MYSDHLHAGLSPVLPRHTAGRTAGHTARACPLLTVPTLGHRRLVPGEKSPHEPFPSQSVCEAAYHHLHQGWSPSGATHFRALLPGGGPESAPLSPLGKQLAGPTRGPRLRGQGEVDQCAERPHLADARISSVHGTMSAQPMRLALHLPRLQTPAAGSPHAVRALGAAGLRLGTVPGREVSESLQPTEVSGKPWHA